MIMGTHRVFLSIGSNLGDKVLNCTRALSEIETRGIAKVIRCSPLYRTEPMDYLDQDWFVNGAVEIETELEPSPLLKHLKQVQADLGTKEKMVRFGPRVIDLDILLFDDRIFTSEDLTIPHERMHHRGFVLVPLCDIAADLRHPVFHKTIHELLQDIDSDNQGVVPFTITQGE